jgi:hypothetical protein
MIISYRRRGKIYAQYLSGEEVLGLRRAERRKTYLPVSSFPASWTAHSERLRTKEIQIERMTASRQSARTIWKKLSSG